MDLTEYEADYNEGFDDGVYETESKVVINLYDFGLRPEIISDLVEIPLDEVNEYLN